MGGALAKPVVLCFVDGWSDADARKSARVADLFARFPSGALAASGPAVGLAPGAGGNGEAGYRTAGGGRAPALARPKIEAAAAASSIATVPAIAPLVEAAEFRRGTFTDFHTGREGERCTVHLFALVSDAGNHASMSELYAVIDAIAFYGLPLVVHAFTDGRDMPPKSAWRCIEPLEEHLDRKGKLVTLAGRAWAMDASGDWDKTIDLYNVLVRPDAADLEIQETAHQALVEMYDEGHTDFDLPPLRIGSYAGVHGDLVAEFGAAQPEWVWKGEDVGIFVGLRGDRFVQLASAFQRVGLPPEAEARVTMRGRPMIAFSPASIASLVPIPGVPSIAAAFPEEPALPTLASVLAEAGLAFARFADDARVAHAAYFFDGGHPAGSPPARARKSTQALAEAERAVLGGAADVVLVALSDVDAAAHAGDAAQVDAASDAIGDAVGRLADAVLDRGGALVVTSSHARHGTDPVPILVASRAAAQKALRAGGSLADVAPTVLELLGIDPPARMTGRSLLVDP